MAGFLRTLFETKAAATSVPSSGSIARATGSSPGLSGLGLGPVGSWDTDAAVKNGYERVIWITRCVDVIAQNQASLHIYLMKGLERGSRKRQVVDNPRLDRLLNFRTNPYESSWMTRYRLSAQALLSRRGVFIEVVKARDDVPAELHLLPPGRTEPIPDDKTFVSGYKVTRADGKVDELQPEKVLWIRLKPHPTDPYAQMTPLMAAGIEADTDFLARMFNRNFLANDGRPGMLVTINPGLTPMNPEDVEVIKQRFSGGPVAAGTTTVIEAEGLNAQDMSATPRDVQWGDLLNVSKERLLMAFGVPESVMGNASGRTFDNADAERENFWMDTMTTHCNAIAYGLDPLSGDTSDDQVFAYDFEGVEVLQRMAQRKRQEYREEVNQGLRTIDEYLDAAGRPKWDVLETRVLYAPNGLIIASNDIDAQAAKKLMPNPVLAQARAQAMGGEGGAAAGQLSAFNRAATKWGNEIAARAMAIKARPQQIETKRAGVKSRPRRPKLVAVKDDDDKESAQVDALESYLVGVLDTWDNRQLSIIADRLDHVKCRKGTRHWDDPSGTVELKALDSGYAVNAMGWQRDLTDLMHDRVEQHVIKEMTSAVTTLKRSGILGRMIERGTASGLGWGGAPAFTSGADSQIAQQRVISDVMNVVRLAAERQSHRVRATIDRMEQEGASLGDIQKAVRGMQGPRGQWRQALAANVANAATQGAQAAVYGRAGKMVSPTWHTHRDEKVRMSHRVLEGTKRPETGQWPGGLRFPSDPLAPASETVNCRCWVEYKPNFPALGAADASV